MCRTANGMDVNGLGQQKDGRGNICPVTIILPTIAMQAKELWETDANNSATIEDTFIQLLDKKIHEAREMLKERFEYICSQKASAAKFMYENNTMAGYIPEEGIRSALKHGTLAMGSLGLAETLQILIGKDHTTTEGMELGKRIYELFKARCAKFKHEDELNYGVYLTPAESLCHTALNKFKDKYGIIPNVSDKEFFTNSTHIPVWKKVSPFDKIDLEAQLACYSSAGCITYVELDSEVQNNIEGLEALVKYALEKDLPYFAINVPADSCEDCGHQGKIGETCPICGSEKILHLRRVTGYLTGSYERHFNKGKVDEVEHRVLHSQHEIGE